MSSWPWMGDGVAASGCGISIMIPNPLQVFQKSLSSQPLFQYCFDNSFCTYFEMQAGPAKPQSTAQEKALWELDALITCPEDIGALTGLAEDRLRQPHWSWNTS